MPPALRGRDVLGLAQTGTGKTAAFVLPILQRLSGERGSGVRALIVTPTRELAAQIHSEVESLARFTRLRSTVVFGGVPIPRQLRELRRRPDVLVACPGRLLDLMERGAVRLDDVEVLVLDEADHMFDMGFLPDVRRILAALPRRRQNLLFSATMPREIRKLAKNVLQDPALVELAHSRPADTIEHAVCPVAESQKVRALESLLSEESFRSAIVFSRTKRRAKRLAETLARTGRRAVALQGNMSQSQRDRALLGFRKGRYDILVATDIAARGLDIAGVSHVINFDLPNTPDAYTHRIGRTGRSGLTGIAYTLATPDDAAGLRAIEKTLGEGLPRRVLEGLPSPERRAARGAGRTRRSGQPKAAQGQKQAPARKKRSRRPAAASRGRRTSKTNETVTAGAPTTPFAAGVSHVERRQRRA